MTVNVAIVGMGQIGTSIGLALAEHKDKVHRIGLDKEPTRAQKAKSMGALDDISYNLPSMVADAGLVLLCIPFNEIESTLQVIAPDLREDAVLLDFSPVKAPVAGWFKEYVGQARHYVGMVPAINPAYLREEKIGHESAHADLFKKTIMGIVAPPGTAGAAVALATDLSALLGAAPLYMDMVEADSLMATAHLLPQLVSSSLLNATVDQPGWREGRQLAGRPYHAATSGEIDMPTALLQASISNKAHIVRALDVMMASLKGLRDAIDSDDTEGMDMRLVASMAAREKWLSERSAGDWAGQELGRTETDNYGTMFQRLFGMGGGKKKKK